jgi:hypothetical protein
LLRLAMREHVKVSVLIAKHFYLRRITLGIRLTNLNTDMVLTDDVSALPTELHTPKDATGLEPVTTRNRR